MMMNKIFTPIILSFLIWGDLFGQNDFEDQYFKVKQIITNCDINSLKVDKGLKLTYEIDSILIRDYALKIDGCNKLRTYLDTSDQLSKLFILYEIFVNEECLNTKWIAHLCLAEVVAYRKSLFVEEYSFETWDKEKIGKAQTYWLNKILRTKEKFPDESNSILNGLKK